MVYVTCARYSTYSSSVHSAFCLYSKNKYFRVLLWLMFHKQQGCLWKRPCWALCYCRRHVASRRNHVQFHVQRQTELKISSILHVYTRENAYLWPDLRGNLSGEVSIVCIWSKFARLRWPFRYRCYPNVHIADSRRKLQCELWRSRRNQLMSFKKFFVVARIQSGKNRINKGTTSSFEPCFLYGYISSVTLDPSLLDNISLICVLLFRLRKDCYTCVDRNSFAYNYGIGLRRKLNKAEMY